MKFWDSSALVPLLVEEDLTAPLRDLYLREPGTITWWGTSIECAVCLDDRLVTAAQREGFLVRDQSRL